MRSGSLAAAVIVAACQISAAQACSRSFRCYFGADSAAISSRCLLIMAETAQTWERLRDGLAAGCPGDPPKPPFVAVLEVRGHAGDESDPLTNRQMSTARAEAVAAVLRAEGVPEADVYEVGLRDTKPDVPNADTAEPQNRFAEVWFH
jgi:outer membrane protein OmpA-like peptidoglycan-associated protein